MLPLTITTNQIAPDLNTIEHLWDVVEQESSCPGCASHKSPSTAKCYPINMGQHL